MESAEARLATTPPQPTNFRFAFTGEGSELFILVLKNILLTILTLGVYAAWAKTEKRKFLWRKLEIGGHRLDYSGTGMELFKGYLMVIAGYLTLILFVAGATMIHRNAALVVQVAFGLTLLFVIPYAIYRSRGYLLSRTSWRGVRFGMAAEGGGEFAKVFLGGYLLSILTLGFYAPFWINNMTRVMTNNSRFGTQHFHYDGVGSELFWIYFKGILLSIVTLGIYLFWLQASTTRYTMSRTSFMNARGSSTITGGTLFWLILVNLIGTTLTLGLAFPWLTVYTLQTFFAHLQFEGEVDFAAISAAPSLGSATNDAMADVLDVGLGI